MTVAGAFICLLIASTLHWKKHAPRFVAWLFLFAGAGLSAVILGYVGAFRNISVLGVGIIAIVAIVTGIVFYSEVVKRNGMHRVRTPLVALLLGVALITVGGPIGHLFRSANQSGGQNVNKAVTTLFNSKG